MLPISLSPLALMVATWATCALSLVGVADALLLTFDQAADYDSPNFLWFRERYPAFVYVDRVVVADSARGRGLARALYDDLFAAALDGGASGDERAERQPDSQHAIPQRELSRGRECESL